MLRLILLGILRSSFAVNDDLQNLDVQPKFITHCITPNKDMGVCVEIQQCTILMDAFRTGTFSNYDFIRASGCGPSNEDKKHPKVCCGKFNNYIEQVTTSTTTGKTTHHQSKPKPITNIFPKTCITTFDRIRVIGGIGAKLGEFPWMARLRHCRSDGLLTYGCSGFLISANFVLTAAHCVRSKVLEPLGPIYQVQLGEHDIETDPDCAMGECADLPQFLLTAEPIVHPGYTGDPQQYNDIAVIPLKESAKFTDYVQPICLPRTLSQIGNMLVSGWGKTEYEEESRIKLKVTLPRTNHSHCVNMYRPIGIRIQDSQLCAGGEEGRDSCTGDSGGPLMVFDPIKGWQAEGVVSFGKGCGLDKWPGVYTSIPYYLPWIEMVINQYLENSNEDEDDNRTDNEEEDRFVWSK